MRKVKKIRFTHVAFAVTFAIGISVFSTPAVAQNDIRATVPVHLRNVHPDVVECYMSVAVGHYGPGEGAESEWYARAVTQLDYDPSGNGSFDGDVVVTIDLRQVYIGNDPSVVSQKFLTKESLQKRSGGCHFDRERASEERTNCLIVRDIEILRSVQGLQTAIREIIEGISGTRH